MNKKWIALSREAAVAAEHMAIGATALSRANYAQDGYFGQAFFALSVGLERASKLVLVIDHALVHNGAFPPNNDLRRFGHKLTELLRQADQVAERLGSKERLPGSPIHLAIINILSEFASNITRYYNLEVLTSAPSVQTKSDPIAQWYQQVVLPVIKKHYKPQKRAIDEQNAHAMEELLGGYVTVLHTSEDGRQLDSFSKASTHSAATEFATPFVRMYVMQILRFLGRLLGNLGYLAQAKKLDDIPYLAEFFGIFNNPDEVFKRRKTWSIYTP